jgi:nicotinate (nicotinamide) nucleotide adenylyltransferase
VIRLFFHFDGEILKVRLAGDEEVMIDPIVWKNRIQFELTKTNLFMMSWTSLLPDLEARNAEALLDLCSARYPVSFDYEELSRLAPTFVVGLESQEWVFFGGTFNPWHAGHQACLSLLPMEKLCFVLPDRSPHKDLENLDSVPTIIELSGKIKFGRNQFLVPTFLLDTKKNPTVNWIERLAEKYPKKKLSLLIGFDSLKNLPTWTRVQNLLPKINSLYVASRLEKDIEQNVVSAKLRLETPHLQIHFLGHHEHESLSSTDLRRK